MNLLDFDQYPSESVEPNNNQSGTSYGNGV